MYDGGFADGQVVVVVIVDDVGVVIVVVVDVDIVMIVFEDAWTSEPP